MLVTVAIKFATEHICIEFTCLRFIECRSVTLNLLIFIAFIRRMFALLFDLGDYATTYRATRDAYLKAANELKLATGPYKAARDGYVAGTATYTKSLYE